MRYWLIIDEQGRYRQVQTVTESPYEAGEDVAGKTVIEMDRFGDLTFEVPDLAAGVWVPSMPLLRDRLISAIEEDREISQMQHLTPGPAKSFVYSQKAAEVRRYAVDPTGTFPAAEAEMALTGDTLAQVIARFEAGMQASLSSVLEIEARAQSAKDAIREAETPEGALTASELYWQP